MSLPIIFGECPCCGGNYQTCPCDFCDNCGNCRGHKKCTCGIPEKTVEIRAGGLPEETFILIKPKSS